MGVFFERLMQHADKEKAPIAPGRRFGKLLEDVYVGTVLGGGFEKLAHLVDKEDESTMRFGLFGCGAGQGGDQVGFGPTAARLTRYKSHSLDSFADDRDGIVASRNDGKNTPSLRAGRQCFPDRRRDLPAEDFGRFCLKSGIAVQQSAERDDQTRFAAAVRTGPRVRALSRFGNMSGHRQENVGEGLRADETFKAGGFAEVGVDSDRSKETAGDADAMTDRHQAASFPASAP